MMTHTVKQSVPQGRYIFEQGDPGDSFYIIHTGSVYVVVNGAQVAQLDAGATFGELSLMRHEPRAATIMASADTDLMYLVSTDYDRILRADQTLQAERKLKFLIKLPVFRDFDEYVPSPIQHSCCLSSVHLI